MLFVDSETILLLMTAPFVDKLFVASEILEVSIRLPREHVALEMEIKAVLLIKINRKRIAQTNVHSHSDNPFYEQQPLALWIPLNI